MRKSTKRLVRVLTGIELADRWIAFCGGMSVDQVRKQREQHKIAYYTGIAIVVVAVVVTVLMEFPGRHH